MEIYNPPQQVPYITTTGGQKLACTIVNIGAWNMVANESTDIAHGLGANFNKIRFVDVQIIADSLLNIFDMKGGNISGGVYYPHGGIYKIDDTNITLYRNPAGVMFSAFFDDAVMNRGYIIFWYEV